jgi:hypothetical protein
MNKTEIYLQVSLMGIMLFTPFALFGKQPIALVGTLICMLMAVVVLIINRRSG